MTKPRIDQLWNTIPSIRVQFEPPPLCGCESRTSVNSSELQRAMGTEPWQMLLGRGQFGGHSFYREIIVFAYQFLSL